MFCADLVKEIDTFFESHGFYDKAKSIEHSEMIFHFDFDLDETNEAVPKKSFPINKNDVAEYGGLIQQMILEIESKIATENMMEKMLEQVLCLKPRGVTLFMGNLKKICKNILSKMMTLSGWRLS